MAISNDTLKAALGELEILPAERLEAAYQSANDRGEPLADFLVERNIITDENMGRLMADIYRIPYINLRNEAIPDDVLRLVPVEMVKRSWVMPFRRLEDGVAVAVNDPGNLEAIAALRKKLRGKEVQLHFATRADIELVAARYRKDIKSVFQAIIAEIERKLAEKPDISAEDALKELPIVQIVDTLLLYAYQAGSSDMHIEPREKEALVRFRIDGLMHDIVRYPKYMHDLIVTRLKIMGRLRTDEHFAAQDGKIRTVLEGETVDVRINIVPIIEGEKVVMRLLTERGKHFYLESIGLSDADVEKTVRAMKKPFGMILSTGPTGSGKTTTLYAMMKILNTPEVNITTIEDPIEYDIPGVSQIQVNPKTGITFAAGLRAIVRQNPDIIMVGEIRDEETASIAVNSAMTGHLVLSTLHTNNAATTLPRLLDMKIEPFLIASSINLIMAQRLVRRICPKCRRSGTMSASELKAAGVSDDLARRLFGKKKSLTVYSGAKCELCRHTGYMGRIGIFELIEMTEPIRNLIMNRANADDIEREAIRLGMTTMLEDGIQKVLNGLTTVEELLRTMHD
ncbi:MAG TPA: ATPase, T2SS/T4P/T4SS family [Candidatus Baltobacteraceae bacterium]|nr:ATPase, T2SS/T4P/T4SS family [Candidatus Baltobacteraceae bacterium]